LVTVACPKCGFEEPESATECSRCGVVFRKFDPAAGSRAHVSSVEWDHHAAETEASAEVSAESRVRPGDFKIVATGFALAVLAYAIPFIRFILHPLTTLVHELGHTVAGWLFGYPSIPSFDFVYGGGITPHGAHQIAIALAVAAGFAYLGYFFRGSPRLVALIGGCFLVWLFIEASEWRRLFVMEAAGHASECIFAGIFFWMAISGIGWRMPEVERPLGAFVAFMLQFNMINFCLDLMHDPDYLEVYRQGKGGMLMHDVDAMSADLTIHTGWHPSIETLARCYLVFAFVPMGLALLWYLRRAEWQRVVTFFYAPQADGPGR